MSAKKIGVLTDNVELAECLVGAIRAQRPDSHVSLFCSPGNSIMVLGKKLEPLDIKHTDISKKFDIIFSVHCRQIFPADLVKNVRCINLHPGLNPFNRGWYPQVFSIINGLPAGATLHIMDEDVDHGAIIDQIPLTLNAWDTSGSAYRRIIELEKILIDRNIAALIDGNFVTKAAPHEGNYNGKKDFQNLCHINLEEQGTFRDFINKLRALTHEGYHNAYFQTDEGEKIYLSVNLIPENKGKN